MKVKFKGHGILYRGNCLNILPKLRESSIDLILTDLPYGTTQNKWDITISLESLWPLYWRAGKANAPVVLTAQAPYDKVLGFSQIKYLKYEWLWKKTQPTGHLNVKIQPMKAHENILVFYKKQCPYFPQKTAGKPYTPQVGKSNNRNYGEYKETRYGSPDGSRYPISVLEFRKDTQTSKLHPTQKPVSLCEYMIKTYTQEKDRVLDSCAGSGTTAIACINTNRRFRCMEMNSQYFDIMVARIEDHLNMRGS